MAIVDKTALSYWFPVLVEAGLPVPRTTILTMPPDAQKEIRNSFDGQGSIEGVRALKLFADDIAEAVSEFGYPFFLRTDHTSGKHNWEETCFVDCAEAIPTHLWRIAEYSEICDFVGLPWSTWAVREILPTIPFGTCPNYGNMPICREFRFFVDEGAIRCVHPYWPRSALDQGGASSELDYDALCRMGDDIGDLAADAGSALGGSWSIDILETKRGWFITDLAEAHKSFHWEGCPKV